MVFIKPCMIIDAVCYLEQRFLSGQEWMPKQQVSAIRALNKVYSPLLTPEYIGMSTLCLIISAYSGNQSFDGYTLDEGISIFRGIKSADSGFHFNNLPGYTASYVLPALTWLKESYADLYIRHFEVLKNNGFEYFWETSVYPAIREQISQKQDKLRGVDINQLLANIAVMKNKDQLHDLYIFVSGMSAPVAFALYDNGLVDCFGTSSPAFLIAHELMHGFASKKCIALYRQYMAQSPYLSACSQKFQDEYHSGEEEELVIAAEYYLMYMQGVCKDVLLKKARLEYGDYCPVFLLLFDSLTKENGIPEDYDAWLIRLFESGRLPTDRIKDHLSAISG